MATQTQPKTGFWAGLGQHFLNLGNSVVGVIGGVGESLSATADYNRSVAEINRATAGTMSQQLEIQKAEQEAKNKQAMLIIALLFVVPLLLVLALFFVKKRGG